MKEILNTVQKKVIPPILTTSLVVCQIMSVYVDFPTVRNAIFLVFFMGGVTLFVYTAMTLRSHHTSFKHLEKPSVLLTTGIFNYSRNPIYLGMLLALISFAIQFYSMIGALIVLGFYYVFDNYYIPMEEDECKAIFKEGYTNYCAKVPRWILI